MKLPLLDQLRYTNGLCAPFAAAAQMVLGGDIHLLYCGDERQFEEHDWPESEPLCLHAFLMIGDCCVDAEGARSLSDLLVSFGVRKGWDYRLEHDKTGEMWKNEFPPDAEATAIARQLLLDCGWNREIPEADGELTLRWEEAQEMKMNLRKLER